jgi:quercetin dioxygenase-like cupin family protein
MAGFTIVHADELERNGGWALVRRGLGVTAFGINFVDIEPGAQIPEHDETARDQEEVFFVLAGDGVVAVVDGERHDAPQGTFIRCDPHLSRTIANDGGTVARVLIVSAPRSSGYEPMDWA